MTRDRVDADDRDREDGGDHPEGPRIERLSESTVERIAAGEVITRPARVVAELLDNALDAGAERIEVGIVGDGTDRVRVRDDGCGMSRADARRATERHATSKLPAGGLDGVESLGFRGEALAAIDEVADLTIRTSDGGDVGTRVAPDGTVADAARARGTTITVESLFADLPARRESLGSAATERRRIAETVSAYAVTRPGVAVSLERDGTETLSTPGSGSYADAVAAVYDRETAARASEFDHHVREGAAPHDVAVGGLLAYPSTTRADRSGLHVAVNGRPVAAPAIERSVEAGYHRLLPSGRHPVAVIAVSVPPAAVDVNVHPAKREVGLVAVDAVGDAVETGVREALTTADLRRAGSVATDIEAGLSTRERESDLADVDVIGRFRELYLLCADGDELLVVDQHAAHERVNFERLRAAAADGAVPTAEIDPPETLSLSPAAAEAVAEFGDELAALGFDVDPFGGTTVALRGVPAPLGQTADPDALRETLAALREGDDPAPREALCADLACHPSLKAGDDLSREAAADLVERLGACEQPYACPHGRPTVLSLPEETLIRGFERSTRLG